MSRGYLCYTVQWREVRGTEGQITPELRDFLQTCIVFKPFTKDSLRVVDQWVWFYSSILFFFNQKPKVCMTEVVLLVKRKRNSAV